ncbi:MAG TPA: dTDP-4-dehydrorhamnose 3,5-epimerase family protein [Rugosimonospora sp.]|nr:dTDP-4-dehydrorhamnose 3,5-epimerase family protein [Rugosimonospora sp.]
MKLRPLTIPDAYEMVPAVHQDERGEFVEWYRASEVAAAAGYEMSVAQANLSVSRRGVVRGIHFVHLPPGQVKYVTCVAGSVLDVVVDLRVGSPTYRCFDAVTLDDTQRRAVLIGNGLGHGFCALTETASVLYLCSTPYDAAAERQIDPLDPELGLPWPTTAPILSVRDTQAPTLARAHAEGLLPVWRS